MRERHLSVSGSWQVGIVCTHKSPVANSSIYTRLYKPNSDGFLFCSDSGVGKTMERIK